MRTYLAARYSRLAELNVYATELRAIGETVTSRWLLGEHQWDGAAKPIAEAYEKGEIVPEGAVAFAQDDIEDIRISHLLISFTDPPRVPTTSRGGNNVEFGYALGIGKRVMTVGPVCNVFHLLVPNYPTWVEALRAVTERGALAGGFPTLRGELAEEVLA